MTAEGLLEGAGRCLASETPPCWSMQRRRQAVASSGNLQDVARSHSQVVLLTPSLAWWCSQAQGLPTPPRRDSKWPA